MFWLFLFFFLLFSIYSTVDFQSGGWWAVWLFFSGRLVLIVYLIFFLLIVFFLLIWIGLVGLILVCWGGCCCLLFFFLFFCVLIGFSLKDMWWIIVWESCFVLLYRVGCWWCRWSHPWGCSIFVLQWRWRASFL